MNYPQLFRSNGQRAVITGSGRAIGLCCAEPGRGRPMGRMGKPEEIARILFLASESSSLMTGAIVNVDGGFTCW